MFPVALDAAALYHHFRGVGAVAVAKRDGGVWFGEAPPPKRGGVAVLGGFGASGDLREPLPVEVEVEVAGAQERLQVFVQTALYVSVTAQSVQKVFRKIESPDYRLYHRLVYLGPWAMVFNRELRAFL